MHMQSTPHESTSHNLFAVVSIFVVFFMNHQLIQKKKFSVEYGCHGYWVCSLWGTC